MSDQNEPSPTSDPSPTSALKKAGLVAGGAVGSALLVFGAAGIAGAQDDEPTLEDPATESTDDDRTTRREAKEARRQAMVDELVAEGVITQDQVDDWQAVREAIAEEREARRAERLQSIADAAGVSVEELQEARQNGESLADVAGDNLPAVVDVIAAEMTEKIEQAVADGRITQEQADERLDGLEERIESRLENGGFGRDGRDGRRGNRGFRGGAPDGGAADVAEAVFSA